MKKIFLAVLVTALMTAATATAADKFAFVDLQRVLVQSDAGKKAKADLEALEKSKKAVIDEKIKAITALEDELNKQASVLSADAKKAKEEELDKLGRDIKTAVTEARAEMQKKENELTGAILNDIIAIVDAMGAEEGYSIIFRSEVIISAKKEFELTDLVLKRFNESKGKSGSKGKSKQTSKEKPKPKVKK